MREGWRLTDETLKPVEKTQTAYRFRLELQPHETKELIIGEHQALMDQYAVSNLTPRDLELFVSQHYLDEVSRTALEKIIQIKGQIADVKTAIDSIDREVTEIGEDQERLRENIKALGENSEAKQLIARYVAKAGSQETRIEQLTATRQAKNTERDELQLQLDAEIRRLALDRRLVAGTK